MNEKILEAGYAKLVVEPPNLKYAKELRDAALRARRDQKGLWVYEAKKTKPDEVFIGDKMSKVFHFPDCEELDDIPLGHREPFRSRVDATSRDFSMCPVCKKRAYRQRTDLY